MSMLYAMTRHKSRVSGYGETLNKPPPTRAHKNITGIFWAKKIGPTPEGAGPSGLLQLTLEGGDGLVDRRNVDLFALRLGVNCSLSYVSHD